jgi:two-component sensor histidine kinase
MNHIPPRIANRLWSVLLACWLLGGLTVQAAEPMQRILVLNSYHDGFQGSDDIVAGFRETLLVSFPGADITIEYLDSKHHTGPEYDRLVRDILYYKYQKERFSLIVSTDDYAFNVLEQHHDQLFPATPVVFCGTNDFDPQRIRNRPDFIGIDERPSFAETLELIFALHPATHEVIAIYDDTITGQRNSADFRKAADRFASRVTFSYWHGLPFTELVHRVQGLQPGAIMVYFASVVPGAHGEPISSSEALTLIARAAKVPIYGGWEFNLGHGIAGGRVINLREHGRAAARLATKVLQGVAPAHGATLQPSPNLNMFDYRELQRFSIPEASLPKGSTIINRPPTFFAVHGTRLLTLLSATLLLVVVVMLGKLLNKHRDLKHSQAKFASMVAAFDGFIYVCSPAYRIEYMNEQLIARTGYDATGKFCYQALHGLVAVCPWCKNEQVFAGEHVQWEIQSPRDGRWYHVSNTPVNNADGTISKEAMITDITQRKQMEEQLHRSLQEKTVMLQEIHHRVKNNLTVVYSLLDLQAKGITDAATRAKFEESRNRVLSMALIHEKLYRSADLAHVDFKEYLQSLTRSIAETYNQPHVVLSVEMMEPVALDVNVGIPCGLIVNELLTNALKYAFPEGRAGRIRVGISSNGDGSHVLFVADNGIGFPVDLDFRATSSLGLQLVNGLAAQIRGQVELSRQDGTRFSITFPGTPERKGEQHG